MWGRVEVPLYHVGVCGGSAVPCGGMWRFWCTMWGRVEVLLCHAGECGGFAVPCGGVWSDFWSGPDATVVCKQLGYSYTGSELMDTYTNQPSYP